jgi:hypothetical protein
MLQQLSHFAQQVHSLAFAVDRVSEKEVQLHHNRVRGHTSIVTTHRSAAVARAFESSALCDRTWRRIGQGAGRSATSARTTQQPLSDASALSQARASATTSVDALDAGSALFVGTKSTCAPRDARAAATSGNVES